MRQVWKAIPVLATIALVPLGAASGRAPEPGLLHDMLACQKESVAATRLACFDKTVAAFGTAAGNDNLVVLDREQVSNAKRSLFGFSMPNLSVLGLGPRTDDATELTATVQSASRTRDGHWRITLDSGAVWVQIDDNGPFHAPHAGSKVVIERALLGTYFIKCDGQIGFRAKRES